MIEAGVFYQRLEICRRCPYWKGACRKGHALQSPAGCPLKRFEPLYGAGYHPDHPEPVNAPNPAPVVPCCTGNAPVEMPAMSLGEVAAHFAASMRKAVAAGIPLATRKEAATRVLVCRSCPDYRVGQCRICKCLVVVKAKLRTEDCPAGRWPKIGT